ncbi:MAG: oligoendopeptidase F [Candidatus Binatia bacterium]|nr:MAG: oligoendopeptidase F [Candidatus Binatia bacterium]
MAEPPPRWDLGDLYRGPDDPRIAGDLARALDLARDFEARYRGRLRAPGGMDPAGLAAALRRYEELLELVAKPLSYAELLHAASSLEPSHGVLLGRARETKTELRNRTRFFELEWIRLPEDRAATFLGSPELAPWKHFLGKLRRYRPHVLEEREERILDEKADAGVRAFGRLFDEVLAEAIFEVREDGRVRRCTESECLGLLYRPERELRKEAARSLTQGLRERSRVLVAVLNAVALDRAVEDRLRSFRHPMEARHVANEVDDSAVEAVLRTCEDHRHLVREYYELKRTLLGYDELYDYDRYAPVSPQVSATFGWAEARELVLEAYRAFSSEVGEIVRRFFDENWIDAQPRPGKRGGAFCSSTVPSGHPYALLTFTGLSRDVLTLAHELGHGVHQMLARGRGILQRDAPLVLAEVASTFGEFLVFERLREREADPFPLLCEKLEESFATIFRQAALTRFELAVHETRRRQGELSADEIGELWLESNAWLYGTSVELGDSYRWWWAYIPHFVHAPFYCYAYPFGELLALALFELYREEGRRFVDRYLDLLRAGGSARPSELLRPFGIELDDPEFWRRGMRVLERLGQEVRERAKRSREPNGHGSLS